MAMLGILELMAAGDASEDQMFEAAKYISAFWFPKEMRATPLASVLTPGPVGIGIVSHDMCSLPRTVCAAMVR